MKAMIHGEPVRHTSDTPPPMDTTRNKRRGEPEFSQGDTVHFHAYANQQPILAKVRAVSRSGGRGPEYRYLLTGIDAPLESLTSAESIVESAHFKDPTQHPFSWH